MANPTSNFNWQMPTPTDLVTDLPADFEVFGQAVDTTLADLKGGTTGQVLAKNSNTDMDFVWSSPNPGDITAVTAGTGISGGGTSGDVTITNSMATAIDAKGDLIAGTAGDTFARLAVGNNGETLVADSAATTGLRYQSAYNGNGCINGGFDIWQRGTSFTAQYVYTADRWFRDNQPDRTFSRQASGLTDFEYSMRVQRNSGATGTSATGLVTSFETSESIKYQGQTVTLSFYAKAGANFSATSSALPVNVYTGTGTNQRRDFGTAFTGEANPINTSVTLTTSWQRFSVTGTISSTATELAIMFYFSPTGTASTNDWFEVTGVQLELGSVATTFKRAGGTLAGELAACQRYCQRIASSPSGGSEAFSMAFGVTSSTVRGVVNLAVPMRTNPTVTASNGAGFFLTYISASVSYFSTLTLVQSAVNSFCWAATLTAGSVTAGQAGEADILNTATAGTNSVILSAEL